MMTIARRLELFWPSVWALAALVLGLVIAAEHYFGSQVGSDDARSPAKVVEARVLPAFVLAPEAEAGAELVARPLFVPTRRPAPPAAASTATVMKRGQFVLTGVTVTPDVSVAFLKEVANGKTIGVKKGAQVNGITVETVEPRRVVLKQGDEIEDLALNVQTPVRVAGAPAPSLPTAPGTSQAGVPPAPGVPTAPGVPPVPGVPPPGAINAQGLPTGSATPPNLPGAQPVQPGSPAPAAGRRRPWINTQ